MQIINRPASPFPRLPSAFIIHHPAFIIPAVCLLVFRLLRYTAAASQKICLAILV